MLTMKEYAKRVFVALLIIIATIVVPYIIYKIFPHFVPFILAYLTALALEPLNNWIIRSFKLTKIISTMLSFFLFLGSIALLLYFFINKLYVQLVNLLVYIQSHSPQVQAWILGLTDNIQDFIQMLPPQTSNQLTQLMLNAINELSNLNLVAKVGVYSYSITTAVPNFFFLILIYFIAVFMFLYELDNIHTRFYSFLRDSSKRKAIYIFRDLRMATFGFLKAQFILSTVTFLICLITLSLLKLKYAAILALVITIVDILPILGTGSFLVPWAVISFIRGNIFLGVSLLVLFLTIAVVRKIIEPKVLGQRIGLNALTTLISIWVGFKVMGILGVFLFPLACIFYQTLVKIQVIKLNKLKL